jgi:hypothetical protein
MNRGRAPRSKSVTTDSSKLPHLRESPRLERGISSTQLAPAAQTRRDRGERAATERVEALAPLPPCVWDRFLQRLDAERLPEVRQ